MRLLSYAFKVVGERPDLQKRLREDRTRAMAEAVADWSTAEVDTFVSGFGRFTAGLSQVLSGSVAEPDAPHGTTATTSQEDR